ncbi:helicase RepA family protein [Burkholderia contaminans]|nr:helicase RepA family protein [Burkholderia contaminans]
MDTDFIGNAVTAEELQRSREQHDVRTARADFFAQQTAPAEAQPMRYTLQSAIDVMNAPPMKWLVRDIVPAEGVISVYGPPGSGKSFLVLDLCAAIAEGNDWFGYRAKRANVVYVTLEGEAGLSKRMKAWSAHNGRVPSDGLRFITREAFNLCNHADVNALANTIITGGGAGLVVIDTLNRAMPGADENSSRDMSSAIAGLGALQRRIGCAVLAVHHTGKDETKGPRGHSSFFGTLDDGIKVSRNGNNRNWTTQKVKDEEDGKQHAFMLRVVNVGDDDGEPVRSCVVVRDEAAAEVVRVKLPQGKHQRIVMDVLTKPFRESRDFGKGDAPFSRPCIELDAAISIAAAHIPCEEKRRNERAKVAITGLVANGIYGAKDGWLWVK